MKRSPSLFTHTLFVLSLLAASVTLPAPAMSGEVVYDLTKGGAGTFFEGGTFTSWIPLGSLPAGSPDHIVPFRAGFGTFSGSGDSDRLPCGHRASALTHS